MAIFLTKDSRVIVQGMTGSEGMKHTTRMLASGTTVVGGVNPRKAGTSVDFPGGVSVPVFGGVAEAMAATGADVTVIFVPAAFTKAAVVEAVDAKIPLCVVITEGVAVKDTAEFFTYAQNAGTTRIIGPNCPGLISPGKSNAGIIPANIAGPGKIGLVSKSGTLTYQMMYELRDYGFSTGVGIGGDFVHQPHRLRLRQRHDHGGLPIGGLGCGQRRDLAPCAVPHPCPGSFRDSRFWRDTFQHRDRPIFLWYGRKSRRQRLLALW